MKRAVAGVVIAGMLASGCTGSFQLTRKVYNFHRAQTDKWTDEIFFLVVTLIPVYSFATLADAVVFNSIEFWTGNNPVSSAASPTQRVVRAGDEQLVMSYDAATGRIAVATDAAAQPAFVLERTDKQVIARDAEGRVLFTSQASPDGGVAVYDRAAQLVKAYSAHEVQQAKQQAAN